MYIEESKEDQEKLWNLCKDNNKKIAFLAQCIRKIIFICDVECEHNREQKEQEDS